MNLAVSGLPAVVVFAGFIVFFSLPVWAAARIIRARKPTLLRSIVSLFAGFILTFFSALLTGGLALLLSPLWFFISFKMFLGTSFFGAIVLGVLALLGYALMVYLVGIEFSPSATGTSYV